MIKRAHNTGGDEAVERIAAPAILGSHLRVAGSYALWLRLTAPIELSVGRLGCWAFAAGDYMYLGSARGPGGLATRVGRHMRQDDKRRRWHIDYLLEHATMVEVWLRPGVERLECIWAKYLHRVWAGRVIVAGFGASDCRCPTHLLYWPALPDPAALCAGLESVARYAAAGPSSTRK
jgi:Uri superfamily endonuclease